MRIYLPSTFGAVALALAEGEFPSGPRAVYAVTPALRAQYGDEEEAEYAALRAAADASLRLLEAAPDEPTRRVVIAADLPETVVRPAESEADSPAQVLVDVAIPLKRVASAHVDDESAAPDIAAGRGEEHELLWYATQELKYLVG